MCIRDRNIICFSYKGASPALMGACAERKIGMSFFSPQMCIRDRMCLNCGHIYEGESAPEKCPVCQHDKGYFIILELSPFEG